MVVIRLARGGAKKRPFFNIVVADSRSAATAASSSAWASTTPWPPAPGSRCGWRWTASRTGPAWARSSRPPWRAWSTRRRRRPEAAAMTTPGDAPAWPADAVEVGRVIGAWGVKGGIRVKPFAADPQALFSSSAGTCSRPRPSCRQAVARRRPCRRCCAWCRRVNMVTAWWPRCTTSAIATRRRPWPAPGFSCHAPVFPPRRGRVLLGRPHRTGGGQPCRRRTRHRHRPHRDRPALRAARCLGRSSTARAADSLRGRLRGCGRLAGPAHRGRLGSRGLTPRQPCASTSSRSSPNSSRRT